MKNELGEMKSQRIKCGELSSVSPIGHSGAVPLFTPLGGSLAAVDSGVQVRGLVLMVPYRAECSVETLG